MDQYGQPLFESKFLDPQYLYQQEAGFFQCIWNFIQAEDTVDGYNTILFILGAFFLTIIFYALVRVVEIRKKEEAHLHHEMQEYAHHHKEKEKQMAEDEGISKNERWRQVLRLLFSASPNDWRLAIIEADSMLEDLLGQQGYRGLNLGEKLKSAGEQGFTQLNSAWQAHIARNRIAHEGSIFELSHHEAKRLIAIYEDIFRQYGYI